MLLSSMEVITYLRLFWTHHKVSLQERFKQQKDTTLGSTTPAPSFHLPLPDLNWKSTLKNAGIKTFVEPEREPFVLWGRRTATDGSYLYGLNLRGANSVVRQTVFRHCGDNTFCTKWYLWHREQPRLWVGGLWPWAAPVRHLVRWNNAFRRAEILNPIISIIIWLSLLKDHSASSILIRIKRMTVVSLTNSWVWKESFFQTPMWAIYLWNWCWHGHQ